MSNEFKYGDAVIWEGEPHIFLSMSPLHPDEEDFCAIAHYGGSLHWVRRSTLKPAPRESEVWFVVGFRSAGLVSTCYAFDSESTAVAVCSEQQRLHSTEYAKIVFAVRGPFTITFPEGV